jgi:hypothetical protein
MGVGQASVGIPCLCLGGVKLLEQCRLAGGLFEVVPLGHEGQRIYAGLALLQTVGAWQTPTERLKCSSRLMWRRKVW